MKSHVYFTVVLALSLAAHASFGAEPNKKPAARAEAKKGAKPAAAAEKAAPPAAPGAPAATAAKEAAIPDTVAIVEGEEIKRAELDQALQAMLAQRGRPDGDLPEEEKSGAYRTVLDEMIVEKLIAKRSAGVKVADEEVAEAFKRMTANFGSEAEIKQQIEKSGQTLEQVNEGIRTSLRQQHWIEEQLKPSGSVTDADAEDFYKKNPQHFKMPERVRASHILLAVPADAKPEAVVEKEKAARAVLARVKKGEDFNKVAAEISEDPSAKQNGGDLDFFAKEQMVPEFSEAAFKMKKDEVSEPVRSQFGYHIIKVTDRKDAETVPLEKAKPQVLAFLKQQRKQSEVQQVLREVREKADVKINLPAAPVVATPPVAAPVAEPKTP